METNQGAGTGNTGTEQDISIDFMSSFKDVEVEGDNGFGENNGGGGGENQQDNADKNKGSGTDDQSQGAGKTKAELDKEKVDQAASEEQEKISKMSPSEKEAYLKNKNTAGEQGNAGAQQNQAKTFDDELLSRFEGKYKNIDEITAALNSPPPELKIEDPFVNHLHELSKAGVKIDQNFVNELAMDWDSIENPVVMLMEDLKRSDPKYKDWTDAELEYEIRHRYRMDEWNPEDGGEPTEVEKIYSIRQLREATEAGNRLKEKQNTLRNIPQPDTKAIELARTQAEERQKNYEAYVDKELIGKNGKLKIPLNEKEVFEYDLEPEQIAEAGKMVKEMGKNFNAFMQYKGFQNEKGKFDPAKVWRMILRDMASDKVGSLIHGQGKAAGGESAHRNLSNTNFENESGKGKQSTSKDFNSAAAKSLSDNF